MQGRTPATVVAAVSVLALMVAGCTAKNGHAAAGKGTSATGNGTSAASNGTSLVYATQEPDHLTPGRQSLAFTQVESLFAPLTETDNTGALHYIAASSVESTDNVTWTITLRNGWKFQNGEAVTPESYVKAWNYTAYGPNAWANSSELSAIVGYSDLNPKSGKPATASMSGLKVTGANTFTVELSNADSQFPLQLGPDLTAFYPMPESAYADLAAYDKEPIGNGPYMMTGPWVPNQPFTVKAWSGYEGPQPVTQEVTFRSYSDTDTAYTDVLAGNADVLSLPADKYTSAKADFGDRLYTFASPAIDYLGFPLSDKQYQDPRIREAISMSIDRDTVNKAIYGGLYAPATGLVSPVLPGVQKDLCGQYCTFDPSAAKSLLAAAGGFKGTITLVYPGGVGYDSLFAAFANQVRQNLGVNAIAKATTDPASFFSELTNKTVAGPHAGHWGPQYLSQEDTLRALFTSDGLCAVCTGYYHNADVDGLLAKAGSASTLDESNGYYAQVERRVLQDFPIVPTFFDNYSYVTSTRVKKLPEIAGVPVLSEIAVSR